MRRTRRSAALSAIWLWLGSPAWLWAARDTLATPAPLHVAYRAEHLGNGLQVVLSEDHSVRVVSVNVTYAVGSGDERPGTTGLAHLLEHMMFQGSSRVGRGEHGFLIRREGGLYNGGTGADRTTFYENLPSSDLDLALFLEADRMRSLEWSAATFANERKVVEEELRLRIQNRAYGATRQKLFEVAYNVFPYRHPTAGSLADLENLKAQDLIDFWTSYYGPNNALLVVVGDFDPARAMASIRQWFGSVPPRELAGRPERSDLPQRGERRLRVEDPFAGSVRLDIGYKLPPGNTPQWYAALVAGYILAAGPASRLCRSLSEGVAVADGVSWSMQHRIGTPLGTVSLIVLNRNSTATVESRIDDAISRLREQPVEEWELQRVRQQVRREQALQLQTPTGRADLLSQFVEFYGDAGALNWFETNVRAVTPRDVQAAAAEWFRKENRTVMETVPKADAGRQNRGEQ